MNKMRELQKLLTKIPKDKVTTYKILAKRLRIHPRVVGMLLSRNPYPIKYPCYKVVRHNGELGGYTSKHGVFDKIKKLEKDGIEIINKKVDKRYFFYF